jgi:hypothetical protein
MDKELTNLITTQENDYINGTTTISKYVDYSMYEDIQKIEAYSNSKFTSCNTDALDREKPFFNIVTSATNIWYRATDIDRKNIKLRATKAQHWIASFLANIVLQNWMRKDNFGVFLNDWGYSLAKYGSSVTKWVEKGGELHRSVVDWNKLIVDPVDFYQNPVIEILELTPSQLKKNKAYDQEQVKALLDTVATRENLDGQHKDNKTGYIKLYEIHGELPLSYITGDEKDEDTYVQQMHTVSLQEVKTGEKEAFTLYSGRESKNPYFITHLIKEDGKTLATGAVKSLFEAQWMMNHTAKNIKDQLDLASKLIFQTSDGNFVGQNALNAIETGQILIHQMNQPLSTVPNISHDISQLQAFQQQWKQNGNEMTGISEAMQGATPKSGTAWRQTEAILQESHSLFDLMTQNKGLSIEEMMREYVIPFVKKQLNNSEEITAILEAHDVEKIDKLYIKSEVTKFAKQQIKEQLLNGEIPLPIDTQGIEQDIQAQLSELGNQRFFKPSEIGDKTWKEIFKDFEWEVEVDVTGESSAAQENLQTLVTLYSNLIQSGNLENANKVMKKILEITQAFSPVELMEMKAPAPQPTQPLPEMPVETT